jgi:hypothetical protein
LFLTFILVFGQAKQFANSDSDFKLKSKIEIKYENKDLQLVTFSQLKNDYKNELIKSYLLDSNFISNLIDHS